MNWNDDRDWDEIIEDEDNPFDNPDDTFYYEENAFKAGYELGFNDIENNTRTDLEREIDYPGFTTEEIIEQFKLGYRKGATDAFNKMFEDTEKSYDEDTEESCDEDCDEDTEESCDVDCDEDTEEDCDEEDVDEENDAEILKKDE